MENKLIKDELQSMELRLSDMEDKLDKLDVKLTQVVDAILGNPLTKQGGFVNEIDVLKEKIISLEKKVEKQEEFKKKVYWVAGIIVFLVMAMQIITNIYSNVKP
jgi:hypothetical protein